MNSEDIHLTGKSCLLYNDRSKLNVFASTSLDHNHPTSPILAKAPEVSEEVKLPVPATMKFVPANAVGQS